MSSLPPEQTPLDRHSLVSLESWLLRLGAERSCEDPCRWIWLRPEWSAEIVLEQEELRVAWEQGVSVVSAASLMVYRAPMWRQLFRKALENDGVASVERLNSEGFQA